MSGFFRGVLTSTFRIDKIIYNYHEASEGVFLVIGSGLRPVG